MDNLVLASMESEDGGHPRDTGCVGGREIDEQRAKPDGNGRQREREALDGVATDSESGREHDLADQQDDDARCEANHGVGQRVTSSPP